MDGASVSESNIPRNLVESPLYTKQLSELGDVERLDEVLRGVLWGISTNPEAFDLIPGFHRLRLAKTREFDVPRRKPLPRLRIWFIDFGVGTVELLAIEREPDPFSDEEYGPA
jgi:hypothetical protein